MKPKSRINWKKHDESIDAKLMAEQAVNAEKHKAVVKLAIERRWRQWKKRDEPKCHDAKAHIESLQKLRDEITHIAEVNVVQGWDWIEATVANINFKIDQLNRTGMAPVNVIQEICEGVPRHVEVLTYDQILAAPFIAPYTKKTGFVGLVRDGDILISVFEDGECVPVARCANLVAISKIPDKGEFVKALTARQSGQAQPPSDISSN